MLFGSDILRFRLVRFDSNPYSCKDLMNTLVNKWFNKRVGLKNLKIIFCRDMLSTWQSMSKEIITLLKLTISNIICEYLVTTCFTLGTSNIKDYNLIKCRGNWYIKFFLIENNSYLPKHETQCISSNARSVSVNNLIPTETRVQ